MLFIQAKPKDRRVYLMPDEDFQYFRDPYTMQLKPLQWNKTHFIVNAFYDHTMPQGSMADEIEIIETNKILNIEEDKDYHEAGIKFVITPKKVGTTEVIVSITEDGISKVDSFEFEVKPNPRKEEETK